MRCLWRLLRSVTLDITLPTEPGGSKVLGGVDARWRFVLVMNVGEVSNAACRSVLDTSQTRAIIIEPLRPNR